mmetsp:Transcript_7499/g.13153  ORF Transcript_7499/g.13153 Transcript_7499/m.13153 type:complete len:280 (+) Transcript_7499:1223-2062(+)
MWLLTADGLRVMSDASSFPVMLWSKNWAILSLHLPLPARGVSTTQPKVSSRFSTLCTKRTFFAFSYIENSGNRFRRGIYEYCANETTPLEIMQSSMAGDVHFMQALEEDKPVRALIRAINRMRGALPRIFALSVMRNNPDAPEAENDENRVDDFRKLAEVVWNKKAPNHYGSEVMSFNTIKETFNTSVEEFRVMKKNVKDYLRDDQTRRFLQRDNAIQGRDNFSRQDALDQAFVPKTHTVWMQGTRNSAYDHLRSRNFESLRNIHEQYFRRPSQYGVHA